MVLYRRKSAAFYLEVRNQLSVLNAKLNESIQGMNIVQVFRQEKRMRKEFEEVNNKHYSAGRRTLKLDALLFTTSYGFSTYCSYCVSTRFIWD